MKDIKTINLSSRLKKIASFVKNDDILADVGSDHGHLVIFLSQNKICKELYAIENKKGPFQILKSNTKEFNDIHVLLSDGIKDIPSNVNSIVIAGMGFLNIKKILLDSKEKLNQLDSIILDSHTSINQLRIFMNSIGFKIAKEELVEDSNKIYTILRYEKGKELLDEKDILFGKISIHNKNDLFKKYWNNRLEYLLKISKLHDNDEINHEIKLIEEVLQ